MTNQKNLTSLIIHFIVLTNIGIISACNSNNRHQKTAIIQDTLKPPVTVFVKNPVVINLDTCPPPRKVIIPAKPGAFSLRKSVTGTKMIQSVPPETRPADFFAPIQNYNTGQGLAITSVYYCYEDKKGNLWFATMGGGVDRFDGKSFTNYANENSSPQNIAQRN